MSESKRLRTMPDSSHGEDKSGVETSTVVKSTESVAPVGLAQLPDELKLHIFSFLNATEDRVNARLTFVPTEFDRESWGKNGLKDRYFTKKNPNVRFERRNWEVPKRHSFDMKPGHLMDYVFMGLTKPEKLALINVGVTSRPAAYRYVDMIFSHVDSTWQKWILERRFNFGPEVIEIKTTGELDSFRKAHGLFKSIRDAADDGYNGDVSLWNFARTGWIIDTLDVNKLGFPDSPDGKQFFAVDNRKEKMRLFILENLLEPEQTKRFKALSNLSPTGRN